MSLAKRIVLGLLLFLFPVFFLTTTPEFFITNKLYLLAFGAILLLALSTVGIVITKKITWKKGVFDTPLSFLLLASAISIVFFSPNKIQALLNTNFGLIMLFSLVVLYMYLEGVRDHRRFFNFLRWGGLLLALTTVFFFFQPFKNATFPPLMQFLRNPMFTPIGGRFELALVLGFFLVSGLADIFVARRRQSIFDLISLIVFAIATGLTVFRLMRPEIPAQTLVLPPYNVSWYAAVEVLKNPLNALFGVGIDNYVSIFTRAKDTLYNQSNLWAINSFNVSRSAILQIFTETGLLGLVAFILVVLTGTNYVQRGGKENTLFSATFLYVLVVLVLFPISLPVLFLFFVTLSLAPHGHEETQHFNLGQVLPLYVFFSVLAGGVVVGSLYLLGRAYAAELAFRKSFEGLIKNSAKELYDNQRRAVVLNPYIERFRINFAQTNLLIATNIAQRATQKAEKDQSKQPQLSNEERQTITQAIQASIQEAKAAVALNPQKAGNWENLAVIYRNLLNAAQGADVWTVSSYQRAIVLDPRNPIYRLNLGGVYYSLKNYPEAIKLFEQSAGLKPDWANAHYNLAWANFQNQSYDKAIQSMENVLKLLDKERNKDEYKKVTSELEEFKKKLPKEEAEATGAGELILPQKPQPELSPKVELPKSASPEAR